jgi:hypothetical protein
VAADESEHAVGRRGGAGGPAGGAESDPEAEEGFEGGASDTGVAGSGREETAPPQLASAANAASTREGARMGERT